MQGQPADLLRSVESFQIDGADTVLTFTRRLARENGWDSEYAQRVVAEYKRFMYLTVVAGHVVTPSEQVDQTWHLHLTYTRSYWDDFCANVLGKRVHHNPTQGGAAENRKYRECYQQTLNTYQQVFGAAPPIDIWPDVEERFDPRTKMVHISRDRYWVIPKWNWSRRYTVTAGVAVLATQPDLWKLFFNDKDIYFWLIVFACLAYGLWTLVTTGGGISGGGGCSSACGDSGCGDDGCGGCGD